MDAIGKISKFRSELMGIATIMILLGHSVFYGQGFVDYGIFQDLFTLGYSGVDIFLFLSGFGLVFSMNLKSATIIQYTIKGRFMSR